MKTGSLIAFLLGALPLAWAQAAPHCPSLGDRRYSPLVSYHCESPQAPGGVCINAWPMMKRLEIFSVNKKGPRAFEDVMSGTMGYQSSSKCLLSIYDACHHYEWNVSPAKMHYMERSVMRDTGMFGSHYRYTKFKFSYDARTKTGGGSFFQDYREKGPSPYETHKWNYQLKNCKLQRMDRMN